MYLKKAIVLTLINPELGQFNTIDDIKAGTHCMPQSCTVVRLLEKL